MQELHEKLEEYKDLQKNNNCEKFLEIVNKIALLQDSHSVPVLMKYLDDEQETFPMESIMIAIESFPPNQYIPQLLKNFPSCMMKGGFWIKGLFYGILNNKSHFSILKQYLKLASKEPFKQIILNIKAESKQHEELCNKLLYLLRTDF